MISQSHIAIVPNSEVSTRTGTSSLRNSATRWYASPTIWGKTTASASGSAAPNGSGSAISASSASNSLSRRVWPTKSGSSGETRYSGTRRAFTIAIHSPPVPDDGLEELPAPLRLVDGAAFHAERQLPIERVEDVEDPLPINHSLAARAADRSTCHLAPRAFALLERNVLGVDMEDTCSHALAALDRIFRASDVGVTRDRK